MDRAADPQAPRAAPEPLRIRRLLPPDAPMTAPEIIETLGLWDRPAGPPERPHVMVNMVSTVDGRASIAGRSGPIAGAADRELFHALRGPVDAVMAGAGTMRVERYGRITPDESRRRMRRERGLREEPLACIVSASLALPPDLPLLAQPKAHVVVLTPADATLPDSAARIDYVRKSRGEELDLAGALSELRDRFAVEELLCEGGPHLNSQLLANGLVDELFLSLAPKLAGGDPLESEALRILAGEEFPEPLGLDLLGVLEHDSHLFLRYGVSARERVSRETTSSSSLAS
ncbi:MAG TPA: dihydrofolate reductase family protein [Solirubrobacteraceae bacterium]|nr:dihydrofolate reductase family protein [Solirubrobacteraceae bacterium]